MHAWTWAELAELLNAPLRGQLRQGAAAALLPSQLCSDSRALQPGDLFVALQGAHYTGTDFLMAAHAAGACAAMVPRGSGQRAQAANLAYFEVADTALALGQLGGDVRAHVRRPLAAITGSNGKTTTKELLAAALSAHGAVHRTQGNLNNHLGVPKTLFAWPDAAWAAVVEMGMSAAGEIAYLTRMASPDVGLVTCVAAAHLEGLGTVANVARAKVELFAEMAPSATRIVNADDPILCAAAAPYLAGSPTLRFGAQAGADVQLIDAVPGPAGSGQTVRFLALGEPVSGTLPLIGRHNAVNAAGALAAAIAMGTGPQAALAAMAHTPQMGGRLRCSRLQALAVNVVDDGYNANPGSMLAALASVQALARGGRVVAVLGEMRELGPTAAALHAALGEQVARHGVAALFALGAHAAATVAAARAGGVVAHGFTDVDALVAALRPALVAEDWLLVKGSRGMRMERVLIALQGQSR